MKTFGGMFVFSFVKQNKNRFSRSLKVGSNLKLTIYSKLNIHLQKIILQNHAFRQKVSYFTGKTRADHESRKCPLPHSQNHLKCTFLKRLKKRVIAWIVKDTNTNFAVAYGRSFLPVDMIVYLRCNLKVVEQPPRGTDQASISHDEAAANEEWVS